MLGTRVSSAKRLRAAVDEVFLRQLEQEVGRQADVEVDVARALLRLIDVQIQGQIEGLYRLFFVVLVPPLDDGVKVSVVARLLLIITQFHQELELMLGVLQLVLFDFAVDHTVQWGLVRLIVARGLLVDLIRRGEVAQHALLKRNLRIEVCVLGLKHRRLIQHLHRLGQDSFTSAAIPGEHPCHIVEQIAVLTLVETHGIDELVQFVDDLIDVVLAGQQIERVDAKALDVLPVAHKHPLNSVECLLPVTVDHVKFRLLK